MSNFRQAVDIAPDFLVLARSLCDRPGVVLAFGEPGVVYVASDPIAVSSALDPEPALERNEEHPLRGVPRWFGLLPYEACRHVEIEGGRDDRPDPIVTEPLWLRYGAVARVERDVVVTGDVASEVRDLARRLASAPQASEVRVTQAEPFERGELHAARIRRALDHIGRGDIYEVNLARRLTVAVAGAPWDVLDALRAPALPPHCFAMRHARLDVVAATPESCLRLHPNGVLSTSPIKGTRPRSPDPSEDRRLAEELEADPKERAELAMIVDVERNDLGRIAETGSVRLRTPPHVVSYPSVHHRVATVEARLSSRVSRSDLFGAFMPSGSVTGAPKRRAMQLIRELEPHRRGLYTGAVGTVRHDGGVDLAMAIRTLVVQDGIGHYFTGGGIVADSDPAREVEETRWKAERLLALMGRGQAENWSD